MRKYVIITADIHPIGGMQLYTAGKASYLLHNEWEVFVLYSGSNSKDCAIDSLNRYTNGAWELLNIRPYNLPGFYVKKTLEHIVCLIKPESTDMVYIESQADVQALWGELLAEKLNAKHICFNCNEQFRGIYKYYEDNIDFFWFKYQRQELLGLHEDTIKKIFEGYYEVPCGKELLFDAAEPEPIQDIYSEIVEKLACLDYNIAYLGRIMKGYVPNIVIGVAQFSKLHADKQIQFIIIGDADARKPFIEETLGKLDNVKITYMGDMVPIPRSIYKKMDVMIAGAVCAEVSAREKVPTIVADCENYLANGILGYTVNNSMYFDTVYGQYQFVELLEDVLVTKDYLNFPYSFPEPTPVNTIYEGHMKFFEKASKDKKYYNVLAKRKRNKEKTFYEKYTYYKIWLYELLEFIFKRTLKGND